MSSRRVRVAAIPAVGDTLVLPVDESHHLLGVRRLARGAAVTVFDGAGGEADAHLADVVRDGRTPVAVLKVDGPVRREAAGFARHLVLGLPKGPAAEHALRMAVELGVTHVHPVALARSVVRGDPGERWARIVTAAAQQCGRAEVPELAPARRLVEVVERLADVADRRVGVPGAASRGAAVGDAAIVIGPEGGLEPSEIDTLVRGGWIAVGLAAHVLRVDTAVAVGLASLGSAIRDGKGPTTPDSGRS